MGPSPTEELTRGIIGEDGLFAHDWKARIGYPLSHQTFINRGGTLPRKPPDVLAQDIGPGKVYSGDDWEMTAAPAVHVEPYLDSLAYRLDSPEGSIVFTGDTEPCQSVVDLARDADVMLCMCMDDQEAMDRTGVASGCCGTSAAAQMAQDAGVKKLLLVHISGGLSPHGPMEKGIGDVKKLYDGEVVFTEELMSVDI